MTEENIFKINDIKDTDPLKNKKISAINSLKRSLERPLIKGKEKNPEIIYQPSHLYWIIEERKGWVSDLFEKYPDLHDPVKKPDVRKKWKKGWGDLNDNSYKILRLHYKLFFTEGLDGNNWREKIRDAESVEKLEEITSTINKSKIDFDWLVLNGLRSARKQIKYLKEGIESELYEKLKTKEAQKNTLIPDIKAAEHFIYSSGKGAKRFIVYDLLKKEIEEVLVLAQKECKKLGINHNWKEYKGETPKPNELMKPDSSDNSSTDSEQDSDTESENENLSPQEIEKKLDEVKKELENKKGDNGNNKPPQNPEEIRKKLVELQGNADNENLRKEIEELRKQLAEIKKTLKEILENAKDFAQKLFDWFKKEKINKITFEESGSAKIEYESQELKNFSSQEVENHSELKELKKQVQQSEQKSLSRQELSQILGSTSSPASSEKEPKHWEKYKYYYLTAMGVGLFIIGGLIVYWWMKNEPKEVE